MKNILVLFMIVHLAGMAQVGSKNFIDQNYIELSGTAELEVVPDEIYISITINEKDKKGRVSVESQEKKLVDRLKAIGIDTEKHLSVQSFGGSYKNYFLRKDGVLKSKNYTLMVSNTDELAKAFYELDRLDISNAYISRVDHSKMDQFRLEVKIKAIQAAKEKAMAYAKAIDQSIGKALHIRESYVNVRNDLLGRAMGANMRMAAEAAPVSDNDLSFKKITINAAIEAKFELK